jgi:hypothetical protein
MKPVKSAAPISRGAVFGPPADLLRKTDALAASVAATPSLEKWASVRKETKAFLQRLFASGHYLEESFRNICADGCPAEEFGALLYGMCLISSFRANSRDFPRGQELLVNSRDISKAQLRALPKKLRTMADMIDKLNATSLAPANELRWIYPPANELRLAPHDVQRQRNREYMIGRYNTLPGLLRIYSWHVERFLPIARKIAKRLTIGHVHAVEIVRYVEDRTGSPHFEDISGLLENGWLIVGETESAPRFLSVDGLTKLYQRWADALCGPGRPSAL